jgi:D-alanine--poly(phosphoribitol) ligase subunit 1
VLHFRGRTDRQVKISGHRIEVDEIGIAARKLPGVRECVALPVATPQGEVSHIALFYLGDHGAPDGEDDDPLAVRDQLQHTLPGYLVPAVALMVQRFPVTANGKVDAAALLRLARGPRPARSAPTPEMPR